MRKVADGSVPPKNTSAGKKAAWKTLLPILILLVGMVAFSFPIISGLIYKKAADDLIQNYESAVTEIAPAEISQRLQAAYDYNDFLSGNAANISLWDPYSQENFIEGLESYAKVLEVSGQLGYIVIPKLNLEAPVYAGTSEDTLKKGIGHMVGTSLPVGGDSSHSALTGHRGLPTAELFTDLDKMQIGDVFYLKNMAGTLAYEIDRIITVEPENLEELSIEEGKDLCTLITCTPYMINSHRLLVRGHRIEYLPEPMEQEIKEVRNVINKEMILAILLLLVIAAVLVTVLAAGRKKYSRSVKKKSMEALQEEDDGKET